MFSEVYSWKPNDNKSALVQVIAWYQQPIMMSLAHKLNGPKHSL